MKKTLILIVALIIATTTSHAQQATATLNHNDTLTTFYGIDAFKDACAKAQYGDVISLSHGQFTGPTINAGVTVIGSGMDADTTNNIMPTIILNKTTLNAGGTFKNIKFEEIKISTTISIEFERCRIIDVSIGNSGSAFWTLYNCIAHVGYTRDIKAINSYIIGSDYFTTTDYFQEGYFENCIIDDYNIKRSTLINCIVIGSCYPNNNNLNFSDVYLTNTLCVTYDTNPFDGCNVSKAWVTGYATKLFKDNSKYYELTDEIKNAYKGTDGKELGIYGGAHTFSHKPMTHHITKCEVAPKTTPDGKLSVHIEVSGQE